MALGGTDLKVTLRGTFFGVAWENILWHRIEGAAFLTATPVGVGEAWWNNVKTAYRAFFPNHAGQFAANEVIVAEPGLTGQYGTYVIPTGEQLGTRTVSATDAMPPFVAAGIRLVVGSRVTRPGQKRLCPLYEQDQVAGVLNGTIIAIINTVAATMSSARTLGAPVAAGSMIPEIARIDPGTLEILVKQDVTGYLTATNATTQNSRKYGRGI